MSNTADLLFEIGTEELPAHAVKSLAKTLATSIETELNRVGLSHEKIDYYATPRRLAIFIHQLASHSAERFIERRGPTLRAAFDEQGQPTAALVGFARSCNTTIEQLGKQETPQGTWLIFRQQEAGQSIHGLLPPIITKALIGLPIPKLMRWSNKPIEFVRPVHWAVLLYGKEVVHADILGLKTDRLSYGHRFHAPQAFVISEAALYKSILQEKGHVIVDFAERRHTINTQIQALAQEKESCVLCEADLLDEVTGLVESPNALIAHFDREFLKIPQEALMAAMIDHQRCFPLIDNQGQLLPFFILVSNITSNNPQEVVRGNERVMRARLADAKFFYETDCKRTLLERTEDLKNIIFQKQLGSLFEKAERIAKLAAFIVPTEKSFAKKAGLFCKADLVTNMVGEFPELQGIMGDYYLRYEKGSLVVATANREHYLPRFAGDKLPESPIGIACALADRLDTLIGIFGIHQAPTGEKDPFALRRAAVAVLRILIERQCNYNLFELLNIAKQNYNTPLPNAQVIEQVQDFILERLKAWYQEKHITTDVFNAVLAVQRDIPFDIDKRVHAVQAFRQLPEAIALTAANKRVSNILAKTNKIELIQQNPFMQIDCTLLQAEQEQILYQAIADKQQQIINKDYTQQLYTLAALREPIDHFFDAILVMEENEKLRNNRLTLLAALRQLFLSVADISILQN
jgi:glycyl-tRNA synthetase beta chain